MFIPARSRHLIISLVLAVVIAILYIVGERTLVQLSDEADPTSEAQVTLGRQLYFTHCSFCHRSELQGQPDWMEPLPTGARRPPPLDGSGNSWKWTSRDLADMIKFGGQFFTPDRPNTMPAFENQLDDVQILAILAFIQSRWPEEIRQQHRALDREAGHGS